MQQSHTTQNIQATKEGRKEIIFITDSVKDYSQLAQSVSQDTQIVILDSSREALPQILDALKGLHDIDALHIVSHGASGKLVLGKTTITSSNLQDFSAQLSQVGASLAPSADVLLYGCDIASDESGRAFVQSLASVIGVDVAASSNATGASQLGGDWDLEVKTGLIEAPVAFRNGVTGQYNGLLLAPPSITGTSGGQTVHDEDTIAPFSNVILSEGTDPTFTVTITLDTAAKGVFTAASLSASGFSTADGGHTYTHAAASAASMQAAMRQLVFDPTDNRVATGSTETTTFTVHLQDSGASLDNSETTVVSKSVDYGTKTVTGNNAFFTIFTRPGGTSPTWSFQDIYEAAFQNGRGAGDITRGHFQTSTDSGATWQDYDITFNAGSIDYRISSTTLWRFKDDSTSTSSQSITFIYHETNGAGTSSTGRSVVPDTAPTNITVNKAWVLSDTTQGVTVSTVTPTDLGDAQGGLWAIDSQSVSNLFTLTADGGTVNTATLKLGTGTLPAIGQTVTVTAHYYDRFQTNNSVTPISGEGYSKTLSLTVIDEQTNQLTLGNDIKVNTTTTRAQESASVTTLSNGNYVVVWQSDGQGGGSESAGIHGIYGQIFDNTGTKVGSEFAITTAGNGVDETRPNVAALDNGRFVVSYTAPGTGTDIAYRIVAANGTVGSQLIANTTTTGNQDKSSIATLTSGAFVMTWESIDGNIYAQKFNSSDGSKNGSEITIDNSGLSYAPSVAALSNGDYVVVWGDYVYSPSVAANVHASIVTSGTPGPKIDVTTDGQVYNYDTGVPLARVAGLTGGGFVVAWDGMVNDSSNNGLRSDIFFQRYNNAGTAQGSNTQVNLSSTDRTYKSDATISALSGGGFIIGWHSDTGDYDQHGIFARRFTSTGTAVDAGDIEINQHRRGDQAYASLTSLDNDRFAAVWTDTSADGTSNSGVETRVLLAPDTTPPTLNSISLSDSALKIGDTSTVTFTFSEAVTGFDNKDITISNGSLSSVSSSDGGTTWTGTFTPSAKVESGTNSISVDLTGVSDIATNAGTGTKSSANYTIDTVRPTATITVTDTTLTVGETSIVTISFSEVVKGFTSADLTVANGSLSGLTTSDDITWIATFTPDKNVNSGTNVITLNDSGITDSAGNAGTGTTDSNNYAVYTAPPAVTSVTQTSGNKAYKAGDTVTFKVKFNLAVVVDDSTHTPRILLETGTTDEYATYTSGSGSTDLVFTYVVQAGDNSSDLQYLNTTSFDLNGATIVAVSDGSDADLTLPDTSGASSLAGTSAIVIDTSAPSAPSTPDLDSKSDTGPFSSDDYTSDATPTFSGTAEANATIKLYDSDGSTLLGSTTADGSGNWSITASTMSDGPHTVSVKATDAAGNTSSASSDLAVTIDTSGPTTTVSTLKFSADTGVLNTDFITKTAAQIISGTLSADLATNERVEISLDNGSNWSEATASVGSDSFSLSGQTLTGSDTLKVRVIDLADNAGPSYTQAYVFDTSGPSLSTISLSSSSVTVASTPTVTFTFSEPVNNFDTSDITVENGSLSNLASKDNGKTWTATLAGTGSIEDATNILTVDLSTITDLAGNAGSGTKTSSNYKVDTLTPSATISISDNALKIGDTATVIFTFNEAVKGFTNADLTIESGTLTSVSSSDGGITWSATFSPSVDTQDSSNIIALNNTGITDLFGNAGVGYSKSANYVVDTKRPTATISLNDSMLRMGETATVTFVFSEAVNGFTTADLLADNGTLSLLSSKDQITWTAKFTPDVGIKSLTNVITLDYNGVADLAGNAGTGTTDSANYQIDTTNTAPTTSNHLSTMAEDGIYTFSASDFNFADADSGDTLQAVMITSLPSVGSLKLNGSTFAANQTITRADINSGLLSFTPVANAWGNSYANFNFKVSDGTEFSASGATWNVNVTKVDDPTTGTVTITGKTNVGQTLTANPALSDLDGLGAFSYKWFSGDAPIRGATAASYTLTSADIGKNIKVYVSYMDGSGFDGGMFSNITAAVTDNNKLPTGTVTFTGTNLVPGTPFNFYQGSVLTATNNISDLDGIAPGAISYQWRANTIAIPGATGSVFTTTQAEVGKNITVDAIYTDNQGNNERVRSLIATTIVNVNDLPTGTVTISDTTPEVGQVLSVLINIADIDGLPASSTYTYQWFADGTPIQKIGTASTYQVRSADLGKAISVEVRYTDLQQANEKVISTATSAVTPKITLVPPAPPSGSVLDQTLWNIAATDHLDASAVHDVYASNVEHQDIGVTILGMAMWDQC